MRIAAYDLGSNSFHMVVADVHADGSFVVVSRDKEMLRLGDVVTRHGLITEDAFARALDTIRRLKMLADSAGAQEHVACATSATRDAANGHELVERIQEETGIKAKVISGKDEAKLIFRAVQASVTIDPSPALCLDLGGGSLELCVGDHHRLLWCTSLRIGLARLAAELSGIDPLPKADQRKLRERVTAALAPPAIAAGDLDAAMMIVTSGTFCDLVRLAVVRRTGWLPTSINNATATRGELEQVHDALMRASSGQRARLEAMDAKRADLMPIGSLMLLTAMDVFGFDSVTAGEWALREGMIFDAIGHHDQADFGNDARGVRRASVSTLGRRCNWNPIHARQVAELSTSLFDQTRSIHGYGEHERELLEYAAMLHDIGEHVSESSHHKHSAYLIEHGGLRGFTPEEITILGCIARYHRGNTPKPAHEPWNTLTTSWQSRVADLAAILRLADGLDRGHAGLVEKVEVEHCKDHLTIRVQALGDPVLEFWGARRKSQWLAERWQRRIEVEST